VSIWHSFNLAEPILDVDGRELDVAVSYTHPERPDSPLEAVWIRPLTDSPGAGIEMSGEAAARLRDLLIEICDPD
jgi:hypothetical protein